MRSIFTRLKPNYPEVLSASAPRDPSQVQLHAERITPGSPSTVSPIRIAYARGVCLQRASDVFANYLLVSFFPSEISSADRRRESLQLEEANYSSRSPGFCSFQPPPSGGADPGNKGNVVFYHIRPAVQPSSHPGSETFQHKLQFTPQTWSLRKVAQM